MSLLIAACGHDGSGEEAVTMEASSDDSAASTNTAIPNCGDVQNMVLLSVFGVATEGGRDEVARWMSDPENQQPAARPGAAEVVAAYRERGYHIFYASLHSSEARIGDQPLPDAMAVWLGLNGFPIGSDDTHIWTWDGEGEASVALIEKLFYVSSEEGAQLDAGYAGDPEMAQALASSGIPRDQLFELDPAEDLREHLPDVLAIEPVCE